MPFALNMLVSTVSLVAVRSMGVGARALGLLTLAAGMPAERFGHYAIALILSELARCGTDFGLDPVLLRRAEGLEYTSQRPMIRAALAVRVAHGAVSAAVVLLILTISFPLDLVLVAAGLQFLPQGMLQLGLNWRQVNNSAHRIAPLLVVLYSVVMSLAVAAYFRPVLGWLPLPLLLVGEMLVAFGLLASLSWPRPADLIEGYKSLAAQALPMAGVMFLAFINTRTDALLVGQLLTPAEAGQYLYLLRWVDLAPMLATGLALPLVGKVQGLRVGRHLPIVCALGLIVAAMPLILVEIGAYLNPAYAADLDLRILLAAVAALRIGLAATTVMLLAGWRDRTLVSLAAVTTLCLPMVVLLLGSSFGAHGMAFGVLIAELSNLLCQVALLLGRPAKTRAAPIGNIDE